MDIEKISLVKAFLDVLASVKNIFSIWSMMDFAISRFQNVFWQQQLYLHYRIANDYRIQASMNALQKCNWKASDLSRVHINDFRVKLNVMYKLNRIKLGLFPDMNRSKVYLGFDYSIVSC